MRLFGEVNYFVLKGIGRFRRSKKRSNPLSGDEEWLCNSCKGKRIYTDRSAFVLLIRNRSEDI